MTTALVVLAAGPATRLDGAFKPSLVVGAKRMIDWQRKAAHADQEILVLHESQHFPEDGMISVWMRDRSRGPVQGMQAAIPVVDADSVLVAFADTWWRHTPDATDWVGLCPAEGGRVWDYPDGGLWRRGYVSHHTVRKVCVGLYAFGDLGALSEACEKALDIHVDREVSFAEMLNYYPHHLNAVEIPEWQDTGTIDTWQHTDRLLRGVV